MQLCVSAALGADMYDSVYPTRTARFGVALVPAGVLKLKGIQYAQDLRRAHAAGLAPCMKPLPDPASYLILGASRRSVWGMRAGV